MSTLTNISGWRPSPFDGRDHLLAADEFEDSGAAARHLLSHPIAVRDQRDVPCCVSIAVVTAMEILDSHSGGTIELSPLFHYFMARNSPHHLGQIEIRRGLLTALQGVSAQQLHHPPFDRAGALQKPTADARTDASGRRIHRGGPPAFVPEFVAVPERQPDAWRGALGRGFPLVIGFWVTPSYERLEQTDVLSLTTAGEASKNGHCVAVLGYTDDQRAFRVKDSRGSSFADNGSWWLPYEIVERGLVQEAWMVRAITFNT